jgi:hypothetical protein
MGWPIAYVAVHYSFETRVPGLGGISSIARVVDDLGTAYGTGLMNFFSAVPAHLTVDAAGRRTLMLDTVTHSASEAELFRIAVLVVDDYMRVRGRPFPGDGSKISYMRRQGVIGEQTPFTRYDYVEMLSNVISISSTQLSRHSSGSTRYITSPRT